MSKSNTSELHKRIMYSILIVDEVPVFIINVHKIAKKQTFFLYKQDKQAHTIQFAHLQSFFLQPSFQNAPLSLTFTSLFCRSTRRQLLSLSAF